MTNDLPLPPHLEQFVREQLARGRFHSECEVIHAALELLEEHSFPHENSGRWRTQAIEKGFAGKPSPSARSQLRDDAVPGVRRSPRGLLADLRSDLSFDDIRETRSEVWSGFPRDALR
jgi:putative addiction module CopG family antidote